MLFWSMSRSLCLVFEVQFEDDSKTQFNARFSVCWWERKTRLHSFNFLRGYFIHFLLFFLFFSICCGDGSDSLDAAGSLYRTSEVYANAWSLRERPEVYTNARSLRRTPEVYANAQSLRERSKSTWTSKLTWMPEVYTKLIYGSAECWVPERSFDLYTLYEGRICRRLLHFGLPGGGKV